MSQGPKGCQCKSKKACFSVASMASNVKANYTPTHWREIKVRRRTFSWRHTHRRWESQCFLQAMPLEPSIIGSKDVFFPIEKWKGQVTGHCKGRIGEPL